MEDHELPPIWNHVFRVRFSRRPVTVQEESEADSLLLADDGQWYTKMNFKAQIIFGC